VRKTFAALKAAHAGKGEAHADGRARRRTAGAPMLWSRPVELPSKRDSSKKENVDNRQRVLPALRGVFGGEASVLVAVGCQFGPYRAVQGSAHVVWRSWRNCARSSSTSWTAVGWMPQSMTGMGVGSVLEEA
jgi:hypothetical protein